MAPTRGFALSALPQAPAIPSNVGKVDVAAIYDAVQRGLQTGNDLRMAAPRQRAELAGLGAQTAKADAEVKTLPSTTQATINTADRASALAAPDMVQSERNLALAQRGTDTLAAQNAGADQKFLGGLPAANRLVFAKEGPSTVATEGTVRDAKGNLVTTQSKTAKIGGAEVPVSSSTSTTPTTPIITPIGGAGGLPIGNLVQTVGADGKPVTQVVQAPLSALNNINTGTTWQKVGSRRDPETGNQKDVYQAFTTSAIPGAQPTPHGAPVEVTAGSGPPGTAGASSSEQPFLSKDALKAIDDTQGEISTLSSRKIELENIANASEALINSNLGAGRVSGPIAAFFGLAPAQEFVGSVQNALQTALQPLRGTGRVSNTEFNQALSALPKITDQPETIRAKLKYLNLATDWAMTRQQHYLENLGSGLNRYQAFQRAQKETPIPEVPDFYSGGGAAAPATQPAPAATTASQNPVFASEAEAAAAHAAGKIKPGDKITVAGQSGVWHE